MLLAAPLPCLLLFATAEEVISNISNQQQKSNFCYKFLTVNPMLPSLFQCYTGNLGHLVSINRKSCLKSQSPPLSAAQLDNINSRNFWWPISSFHWMCYAKVRLHGHDIFQHFATCSVNYCISNADMHMLCLLFLSKAMPYYLHSLLTDMFVITGRCNWVVWK